ncbi:MAG: hypothetical protein JSS66_10710 [Armatimonadetes bacterium]|nr:hypothetical protein [Armatimonadota bacterium]
MSVRGIVASLAVLAAAEASLIFPMVSNAQLAETMTATSIHGQLQKTGMNAVKAGFRGVQAARANNKAAAQQVAYGAQAFGDGQTAVRPDGGGAPGAGAVAPFDERNPVKGTVYSADGMVVWDGVVKTQRVIFLVRISGPNQFQILGFRPHDPMMPKMPKNAQVSVTGVYAARIKEPTTGSMVHGFDDAVFSAPGLGAGQAGGVPGPGVGQADQAKPQAPEKPSFSTALKGWSFRGMAQVGNSSTGVFVNDTRVRYLSAGEKLDDGVVVTSLKDGRANLTVDNKKVEVDPW